MANLILDASPGKKKKGIPTDPDGRKAYYERLMAIYEVQNPKKFLEKKAELLRKAAGEEYIAGKWVNIFTRPAEEQKLTPVEREALGIQEKLQAELDTKNRLVALEAENIELKAKLGAVVEKPKGRPKKTK